MQFTCQFQVICQQYATLNPTTASWVLGAMHTLHARDTPILEMWDQEFCERLHSSKMTERQAELIHEGMMQR